jgi:signal transduction histidine kinase
MMVRAQEEERKRLSRELHDQVGQMLTALRMEVGRGHQAESKALIDTMVATVRDLSMGLRPSMLDDIGLGPALQWLARDHARRFDCPVNVELSGDLDALPESHRTCTYRVVQEALTNCARHAQARRIDVALHGTPGQLRLQIKDDGVGMPARPLAAPGLGLFGIEERVRELGGRLQLYSQPGQGTSLKIEMPIPVCV